MAVPPCSFRDALLTDGAEPVLFLPQAQQLPSPFQGRLIRNAQAFLEIGFPFQVVRVCFHLDLDVSPYLCVCCIAEPDLHHQVIKKYDLASLAPWLVRAQASGLPELVEFARGIVRDQDAMTAALRYEASNGITEGHINRLKLIKRTADGRASFELLRKRVQARV